MNRPSGLKYKLHKINPTSFKKGNTPWNKGKKMNISPWNKGLTKKDDRRIAKYGRSISLATKGKKRPFRFMTKEERINRSNSKLGNKNPAKRKEVRNKIRKTLLETYKEHPEILDDRKPAGLNQYSDHFTSIEKMIAEELDSRNISFVHNYQIGRYFPDFIIFENVIIECDGKYWHKDKSKEQRRDRCLHKLGYFIFHLKESRVTKSSEECINMVKRVMKSLYPPATGFECEEMPSFLKKKEIKKNGNKS